MALKVHSKYYYIYLEVWYLVAPNATKYQKTNYTSLFLAREPELIITSLVNRQSLAHHVAEIFKEEL